MSKPYYNKLIAGFRFDYARKAKSISYGGIRKRKTIKAVALHWTEGSSDTCFNECDYFATGNDRSAGANIFIDRQGHVGYSIPLTRIAWSVMSRGYDDGSYSGILDNTNTVSIELCSCKDPVTGKALPMNAEQEGKLYEVLRWIKLRCKNCDSFVRHYDIRKKPCPAYYVENTEEWNHLKKYVETLIFKKGA